MEQKNSSKINAEYLLWCWDVVRLYIGTISFGSRAEHTLSERVFTYQHPLLDAFKKRSNFATLIFNHYFLRPSSSIIPSTTIITP